jgi:organic hydroperoxide reductase OsmC/OhrA
MAARTTGGRPPYDADDSPATRRRRADSRMTATRTHHYRASCSWAGSTASGYDHYDRSHEGGAEPASASLALSSDPAFGGRPERLNPEQLLLLAASSCQLLSFLAVAARARLDVIAYHDDAEAVMPEDDPPLRVTDIWLRPRIEVRAPATTGRVLHLAEVAHRECFIANSFNGRMNIEPTVVIVADA